MSLFQQNSDPKQQTEEERQSVQKALRNTAEIVADLASLNTSLMPGNLGVNDVARQLSRVAVKLGKELTPEQESITKSYVNATDLASRKKQDKSSKPAFELKSFIKLAEAEKIPLAVRQGIQIPEKQKIEMPLASANSQKISLSQSQKSGLKENMKTPQTQAIQSRSDWQKELSDVNAVSFNKIDAFFDPNFWQNAA